jgi:hypothetical protein
LAHDSQFKIVFAAIRQLMTPRFCLHPTIGHLLSRWRARAIWHGIKARNRGNIAFFFKASQCGDRDKGPRAGRDDFCHGLPGFNAIALI